jgi:DNA-directed RNA polymerase subunit beta'
MKCTRAAFSQHIDEKPPRETTKTRDINGGLARVVELFEALKPRESAIMAGSTAS